MGRDNSYNNKYYRAYRKIRFVSRKGSLFTIPALSNSGQTDFPASTFRIISLNSFFLFLLAYLTVYLLELFITGVASLISNIPCIVYYHGVDFIIRGKDWTMDSINIVFSSGPLIMAILAITFAIVYIAVATETGMLRLFLIWVLFHSITRCMGEILVGAITNQGFGYVIIYAFMMDTEKLMLTIGAFVSMFTIGLFIARQIMFSANIYFNNLRKAYRPRFILYQFFLPFFAGDFFIFLIKLPKVKIFDISVNLTMILLLIPLMVISIGMEDLYFDEEPRKIKLSVMLPLATLLIFVFFRIIFGFGIRLAI